MKFSKWVLVVMAISLAAFVVAMIWQFDKYQIVPDALIYSFFGLFTGEAGFLALIKTKEGKE